MFDEYKKMGEVLFCLLDVHETEREKRLCERGAAKDVIDDLCQLHDLREKFKDVKFKNTIIDTSKISIKEVGEKVVELVEKNQNA